MKKFKTLSFAVAVVLLLLGAGPLRSACAATYLETSLMVAVSTTVSSPTTIVSATNWAADVGILLNWSGSGTKPNGEYLLLSSSNSGFSNVASTGTARIAADNSEASRLWLNNYNGPLYGVVIGTTSAQNVSVIRKK